MRDPWDKGNGNAVKCSSHVETVDREDRSMKKHLMIVLLAASLAVTISGCQKQETEETVGIMVETEESETETPESIIETKVNKEEKTEKSTEESETWKIRSAKENLEGMALYSSCPFVYEDSEWELQTFVREDMLIDGELAMDDSGHFLIQAISGEDSYVFLDDTIQLGVPEADVWVDDQNKMHIVIRDVRTARYRVTDFVFDSEEKTFIGTDVLSGEGINYMGTTGK